MAINRRGFLGLAASIAAFVSVPGWPTATEPVVATPTADIDIGAYMAQQYAKAWNAYLDTVVIHGNGRLA